jgi:hypothetical protein
MMTEEDDEAEDIGGGRGGSPELAATAESDIESEEEGMGKGGGWEEANSCRGICPYVRIFYFF